MSKMRRAFRRPKVGTSSVCSALPEKSDCFTWVTSPPPSARSSARSQGFLAGARSPIHSASTSTATRERSPEAISTESPIGVAQERSPGALRWQTAALPFRPRAGSLGVRYPFRLMKSLPGRPAWLALGFVLTLSPRSLAQSSASFPDPPQPAPPPPPPHPPPSPAPPQPAPAPPQAAPAPPPATPAPPPAYGQPQYYEPLPPPPPPPEPPEKKGFKMPPWSVRIDPFLWLF